MKKTIQILCCCVLLFGVGTAVHAESIGVCPSGDECDFHKIQNAIDSASDGDYIGIEAGTYTENLNIPKGLDITITGNSLDATNVVIRGKVRVRKNADLELTYVVLNANGKANGIRVMGDGRLNLKYGDLKNANAYGILAEQGATVDVYDQKIRRNGIHGVLARKNSRIDISRAKIKDNQFAGLRAFDTKNLSIKDSTLRNNDKGISLKNSEDNTVCWRNDFIKNRIGIRLKTSAVSRTGNTFTDNTTNFLDLI